MIIKNLWVVLAIGGFASSSLAQETTTEAAVETVAAPIEPDCSTVQDPSDLGEMFGDERFANNLEALDKCITQFILDAQNSYGGNSDYDAAQAFDELDEALSIRVELFRRLGERFRFGSEFSDSVQALKVELDLIEADIVSNESRGTDMSAARSTLAADRERYDSAVNNMETTRQQFSEVINEINEFRPVLAVLLRQKRFQEYITRFETLTDKGSALAETANSQIDSFINDQTEGRQGQN